MAQASSSVSPVHLKPRGYLYPFRGRSDVLLPTKVFHGANVRSHYLSSPIEAPPPIISSSEFVHPLLIHHLMRNKKNRALGVKFEPGNNPPDAITNMEGALHTFVTPIVQAMLHGEYAYYAGQHMMLRFLPTKDRMDYARQVVVSAFIHPDFEDDQVMLQLASLTAMPSIGASLPMDFEMISPEEKQIPSLREAYDFVLRAHMIAHLVSSGRLPGIWEVQELARPVESTIDALENWIKTPDASPEEVRNAYFCIPSGEILSLELLFNSALHQVRNELSALEAMCPQGYVYTFDPPAIFARMVDATLLNRLFIAAVKTLSKKNQFKNMRCFAFNDYADPSAFQIYLPIALQDQKHVLVTRKLVLFTGKGGQYVPPKGMEEALLVLHNNSDGFGQNIETEAPGGSMDGAIGAFSSVAASLRRDRPDLLNYLM
ncbi:hypothetical protein CALVIDRAFT_539559 [Calocera viscosa TUFC12733]|uniref:Uncharacterized protein n=1 Tax=Calocera viscosa (strain TUFC12733) TaxID=1330018 RepID=A0A167JUA8_CALVF|nr:hypothetical protein CALVIDRAFT_539559 [Calocera viscosa TUFC12733]